jgi:hypothetical protein
MADARVSGSLLIDNNEYRFDGDRAYLDRNWGTRFPRWWIWIAANNFLPHLSAALVVGGGGPGRPQSPGMRDFMSVAFTTGTQSHLFRTTHGERVKLETDGLAWYTLHAYNRTHAIRIRAQAGREDFYPIALPTPQGACFHNSQTLRGRVDVDLFQTRPRGRLLLEGSFHSEWAGIEFGSRESGPTGKE